MHIYTRLIVIENIFDSTIFTHLKPAHRLIALEHPVLGKLCLHTTDNPVCGKRGITNHAIKRLFLVQDSRLACSFRVVEIARTEANGVFRTGFLAQTTLLSLIHI